MGDLSATITTARHRPLRKCSQKEVTLKGIRFLAYSLCLSLSLRSLRFFVDSHLIRINSKGEDP